MKTKLCAVCRQWKPLEDFHKNRCSKDGRQSRCKACNTRRDQTRGFAKSEDARVRDEAIARFRSAYKRKPPTRAELAEARAAGMALTIFGVIG